MDNDHWFDLLNKEIVRGAPRRDVLRSAAALATGFLLGGATAAEAAKKKRKNKKKKRRKRRPNPKSPTSCSKGACAQHWPGDQQQIDYCEFICRQCDGDDSRQFCIVQLGPDKVATCCPEEAECCGGHGGVCCGGDPRNSGRKCCDGQCVDTDTNKNYCGSCNGSCGGFTPECCNGFCTDIKYNRIHCGACDASCQPGEVCCDGKCKNCGGFIPCC